MSTDTLCAACFSRATCFIASHETATFVPVQAIATSMPSKLGESGQKKKKPLQPALDLKLHCLFDQAASNDSAKPQVPAAAGVASAVQPQAEKPVIASGAEQRDQGTALQAADGSSTSHTADIVQDPQGLSVICLSAVMCMCPARQAIRAASEIGLKNFFAAPIQPLLMRQEAFQKSLERTAPGQNLSACQQDPSMVGTSSLSPVNA